MDSLSEAKVDLQTAADQLGVHYQTAYRWVRNGRLDAELIGGRYLVSPTDISELDRARHTPSTPPAPRPDRLEHAGRRMHEPLAAGDEPVARKIARRLAEEGTPLVDLIETVLVPPMREIGLAWQRGDLAVWAEHRASAIVERLLGELAINPRGRRRGVAAVTAVSGDHHSLPTTMAAVALRSDNWQVHHLGADLPPDELTQFCKVHQVGLVVITVTNPEMQGLADETADALRSAGTPTIVGGSGRNLAELIDLARREVA